MFTLFLVMLPLIEIAGFILIGGEIGVGWSLLWVIVSVFAGFYFLMTMGRETLKKAKKSVDADAYPFEEMFDGICILIGAVLLIFPGFASDIMALFLLVPFIRHAIFRLLKYQHEELWRDLGKNAEGFTYWYYEERNGASSKTIEGEFRHEDRDQKKIQ